MKTNEAGLSLLTVAVVVPFLSGRTHCETITRDVESQHHSRRIVVTSLMGEAGDSVSPGPTKSGERESTQKQVRIVTVVVITAMICTS